MNWLDGYTEYCLADVPWLCISCKLMDSLTLTSCLGARCEEPRQSRKLQPDPKFQHQKVTVLAGRLIVCQLNLFTTSLGSYNLHFTPFIAGACCKLRRSQLEY